MKPIKQDQTTHPCISYLKFKEIIDIYNQTFMESPWASITEQKISTICTNDACIIIILGRITTTFWERYCQFMQRHPIRCVNVCIAAKRHKYNQDILNKDKVTLEKNCKASAMKTYGFRREAQPAWASNCEGLTCTIKRKEHKQTPNVI